MSAGWPTARPAANLSHPPAPAAYQYSTSKQLQTTPSDYQHANEKLSDPAFTPVSVRQGFSQYGNPPASSPYTDYAAPASVPAPPPQMAPAVTSQPSTSNGESKVAWPDSVREYVQRSFLPQNDDPSVTRAEIEAKLKEIIGAAKQSGNMYSIDWDAMPLPQVVVKTERSASLLDTNARKRKSSDFQHEAQTQAPWRNTNNRSSLGDRITHPPSGKRINSDESSGKLSKSQKEANKRKRRFEAEYAAQRSPSPPPPSSGPIVGTCETLEKRYLRLTAPPVPSKVRPERILRQTLDLLKKKWKKESNYSYICDQFKSMRQDLTVQHLKNEFTVSVYEIHARIALEKGDLGEYNQCQTQLRSLYGLGLKGNHIEFKAYRILYFIHTANRSGLNDAIADLTTAEKEEWPIKHALNVRSALALGNYHKVFQLYLDTPNMGAYLMDMFVVRERLAALCNICKA